MLNSPSIVAIDLYLSARFAQLSITLLFAVRFTRRKRIIFVHKYHCDLCLRFLFIFSRSRYFFSFLLRPFNSFLVTAITMNALSSLSTFGFGLTYFDFLCFNFRISKCLLSPVLHTLSFVCGDHSMKIDHSIPRLDNRHELNVKLMGIFQLIRLRIWFFTRIILNVIGLLPKRQHRF